MDEARRFLRYVTPGLVFALEYVGLLLVLIPTWAGSHFESLKGGEGIGVAVTLFLASGAVGFVLSTIHHALQWRETDSILDHRKFVRRLVERGIVEVSRTGDKAAHESFDWLTRERAWAVLTALWHERAKEEKAIEGATSRATALTDLAHSLGTMRVSSLLAPMAALLTLAFTTTLSRSSGDYLRFLSAVAISLGMWLLQNGGYRRAGRLAHLFIEQTLTDVFLLPAATTEKAAALAKVIVDDPVVPTRLQDRLSANLAALPWKKSSLPPD